MSIGHSPKNANIPPSPGSASIPTLKSLRSLLAFGPGKPSSSSSSANGSPPHHVSTPKNRFHAFDGVRRSIQRDRSDTSNGSMRNRMSLNLPRPELNVSLPVISIVSRDSQQKVKQKEKAEEDDGFTEHRRKRSISLSGLPPPSISIPQTDEYLPSSPPNGASPERDLHANRSPIPSPLPSPDTSLPSIPPPTDLSTIIEADTSGISKHLPSPSPSPSPSPARDLSHSSSAEFDLQHVSASELTNEVREAMRMSETVGNGRPTQMSWLGPKPRQFSDASTNKPTDSPSIAIVDDKDLPVDPEQFALELDMASAQALDPSLTALLSPNNLPTSSTVRAPLSSSIGRGFSKRQQQTSRGHVDLPFEEPKRSPSPLASGFDSRKSSPRRLPAGLPDPRTPSASPSPTRATHVHHDQPIDAMPRRGSTTSATGTAESWSPARSTVAWYARRGGAGSSKSTFGASPPSPLSANYDGQEEWEARPRRTSGGASRLPRSATSDERPSMLRTNTSPTRPWSDADGLESELGTAASAYSRPASAMSRILTGGRVLRTPTVEQLRSSSSRGELEVGSISGDLGRRRSSFDTPRNRRLERATTSGGRGPSPSVDFSARPSTRAGYDYRRAGNWPSSARRRSASVDQDRSPTGIATAPIPQQNRFVGRPTHEWLGPRTTRAFKAAGLLDDLEDQSDTAQSRTAVITPRLERESSIPSRVDASSRFGSVRSTSDYNSGYFALGRRGYPESGRQSVATTADHSPVGESPTFTLSSTGAPFRDRDVLRSSSVSTAPTSISSHASGDRDFRDREVSHYRAEIASLKERHATESSALLSALSDSQRVAKVLRDENDNLRQKLALVESEVDKLNRLTVLRENEKARQDDASRWRFANAERENEQLRREARDLKALVLELEQALVVKRARPSLLENEDSLFEATDDEEHTARLPFPSQRSSVTLSQPDTPVLTGRQPEERRLSGASSVFPPVPANMSMLLHDDDPSNDMFGDRSGFSEAQNHSFSSQNHPSLPSSFSSSSSHSQVFPLHETPSAHVRHKSGMSVRSFRSTISAAPSVNSSIMTDRIPGSPASLQLSPEHDLHLRDMEHFTLGMGEEVEESRIE